MSEATAVTIWQVSVVCRAKAEDGSWADKEVHRALVVAATINEACALTLEYFTDKHAQHEVVRVEKVMNPCVAAAPPRLN